MRARMLLLVLDNDDDDDGTTGVFSLRSYHAYIMIAQTLGLCAPPDLATFVYVFPSASDKLLIVYFRV